MKTILLIRHAKSGWANIQESDYEREINNTGKKEALLMSDKLFKKNKIRSSSGINTAWVPSLSIKP